MTLNSRPNQDAALSGWSQSDPSKLELVSELQLQYLVERQNISRAIDAVINAVFESSKSLTINSRDCFPIFVENEVL